MPRGPHHVSSARTPVDSSTIRRRLVFTRRSSGSAGAVGGEDSRAVLVEEDTSPSLWSIIRFAVPISAIFVTNFVMGAIDSYALGRYGGTVQLGALSPALTVTEYCVRERARVRADLRAGAGLL